LEEHDFFSVHFGFFFFFWCYFVFGFFFLGLGFFLGVEFHQEGGKPQGLQHWPGTQKTHFLVSVLIAGNSLKLLSICIHCDRKQTDPGGEHSLNLYP